MGEEASFEMLEFMSAVLFSLRVPSFKILFYRPADIVWEKKIVTESACYTFT